MNRIFFSPSLFSLFLLPGVGIASIGFLLLFLSKFQSKLSGDIASSLDFLDEMYHDLHGDDRRSGRGSPLRWGGVAIAEWTGNCSAVRITMQ
jgi:hypothetical protein